MDSTWTHLQKYISCDIHALADYIYGSDHIGMTLSTSSSHVMCPSR